MTRLGLAVRLPVLHPAQSLSLAIFSQVCGGQERRAESPMLALQSLSLAIFSQVSGGQG